MPELPEVETIKNELAPAVIGRCLARVAVYDAKAIRQPSVEEFERQLAGRTVASLGRRGKYLIFGLTAPFPGCLQAASLDPEVSLIVHLKLTGALLMNAPTTRKYGKVLFEFDDGSRLLFIDPRRFGRMWLVADPASITGKLGPEPLTPDFTIETLARRLHGRQAPIKAVLLDQNFIAGVGNMYADEALFAARIHPEQAAGDLTRGQISRLHAAILSVLSAAIANKGASTRDYIRPDGQLGTAHFSFNVAHRRGELCPVCRRPIRRIVVRNRGTYFCSHCQRRR